MAIEVASSRLEGLAAREMFASPSLFPLSLWSPRGISFRRMHQRRKGDEMCPLGIRERGDAEHVHGNVVDSREKGGPEG